MTMSPFHLENNDKFVLGHRIIYTLLSHAIQMNSTNMIMNECNQIYASGYGKQALISAKSIIVFLDWATGSMSSLIAVGERLISA